MVLVTGLGVLGDGAAARAAASAAAGEHVAVRHAEAHRARGPRPLHASSRARGRAAARRLPAGPVPGGGVVAPKTGEVRAWLASDEVNGHLYAKDFTLRGTGERIEVWVAGGADEVSGGLDFPAGDCRNGPRTRITDAQVRHLIAEFDENIHPRMSAAFSAPRPRDGSGAGLPGQLGLPAGYFAGPAERVVVLVDNVRDTNFHDRDDAQELPYTAGLFDPSLNDLVDRNVLTLDGFDWQHRTGGHPPHEPVAGDPCASAPAEPHMLEGILAHEYQHLLAHQHDPDETTWLEEGLSTWAETVTGYKRPDLPVSEVGFDVHVQCFLGHLGGVASPAGGPQNSLTLWGDQGPENILCDYGAARTLVGYLAGRYGEGFVAALHRDPAHGLDSLRRQLEKFDPGTDPAGVLGGWAVTVALDGVLDDGAMLDGGEPEKLAEPTLHASVNWDSPGSHDTPGAPPNGADYVRLRDATGRYLTAAELDAVDFDGADTLPPRPVEWAADPDPPGRPGDPALRSGTGRDLDRSVVREVAVPAEAGAARLTFDTSYDIEDGFDFGFVRVSTDGGRTYQSLAGSVTTAAASPRAEEAVAERLPGVTGTSGGGEAPAWVRASFDLSRYAGRRVLLAFTYMTDGRVTEPGWWVDNVRVGPTLLTDGSGLSGWRSATQVRPLGVHGFGLRLVAYAGDRSRALLARLPLDAGHRVRLDRRALGKRLMTPDADMVAAIVTYSEPTESREEYAPYELTVNGVLQPGGTTAGGTSGP